MFSFIWNIIIESRPRQWVKNLTIFVFLVFSREFFIPHQFLVVLQSFFAFTLLTSSVYFFNDLIDFKSDKNNPGKKKRPIASGKISKTQGFVIGTLLLIGALVWAYFIGEYLLGMSIFYFILMIGYSIYLKNLVIFDALVIAGGFVIRVLAGAFIINVSNLYSWLVIVTISVSLLLAFGKRRSEITLMGDKSNSQRKVLSQYPIDLLNSLISALFASTFLSYILFTFQTDLTPVLNSFPFKLPSTLARSSHLLKFTIPIVFYGLARYLYLIYTKKYEGTPEEVLFKDVQLLVTAIIWVISLFLLLYVIV